jgi:hypothetical protein
MDGRQRRRNQGWQWLVCGPHRQNIGGKLSRRQSRHVRCRDWLEDCQVYTNLDEWCSGTGIRRRDICVHGNETLYCLCRHRESHRTSANVRISYFYGRTRLRPCTCSPPHLLLLSRRVIAVSPTGSKILKTAGVPGIQSGTPLTTYDGRYILINSNLGDQGYFSVFDTTSTTSPIPPVYQFTGNTTAPFAPLGGFLKPAEGYYDGGENNTNDFYAWSTSVPSNATSAGTGQMYAFQMPMDSSSPMSAFALGGTRTYELSTSPVFTNHGRSMYFAATKAQERCSVGQAGSDHSRFNRDKTTSIGLTRGTPQYVSAPAPPSFGGSSESPSVYGPGKFLQLFYSLMMGFVTRRLTTAFDCNRCRR